MLIALGWFSEHGQPFDAQATGFYRRLRHFVERRVPESWSREVVQGPGWGMFGAAASPGGWNWDLVSRDQDGLVATVGLPVGLDDTVLSGGPIGIGRAVLAGQSVLDGVVPPFGVLATDGTRFAAQQDWFGMASIYVYRSHGVVAFSNRPILLPYVFGDPIHPDAEGFARYAACDAFVGSVSPVTGVKPLGPGEAFIGRRNPDNTWKISVSQSSCLDDAAVAGARLDSGADLEALTVASFSRATSSLARLWPATDLLRCGLSGGRDSRLLAANLLAEGILPEFYTNTENPEEGVVASRLVELARGAGRSGIIHDLVPPRSGSSGGTTGVGQRLTDLFWHYDFSYRRQFVLRGSHIPDECIPPATINGAIGGIAWGAWVPETWSQSSSNPAEEMDLALRRGLISKAGGPLCEPAAGWVDAYLGELIEHAALLGLDQVQSLTWTVLCDSGPHLANSAAQLPTDHAVRDAGVRLGRHRSPAAADEELWLPPTAHRAVAAGVDRSRLRPRYRRRPGEYPAHLGRGRPPTAHRAFRLHDGRADLDARPEQGKHRPAAPPPRGVGRQADVHREPAAHNVRGTCRGRA